MSSRYITCISPFNQHRYHIYTAHITVRSTKPTKIPHYNHERRVYRKWSFGWSWKLKHSYECMENRIPENFLTSFVSMCGFKLWWKRDFIPWHPRYLRRKCKYESSGMMSSLPLGLHNILNRWYWRGRWYDLVMMRWKYYLSTYVCIYV